MTFFRADIRVCPAALIRFGLVAGLWLCTMPALAQVDLRPDQPIATRATPESQPAPTPVPAQAPVQTQMPTQQPTGNANRSGVVTSSLAPIEPLSIALLSPSQGGMRGNVWGGSSAYALTKLLTDMPGQGASPLLNDMTARVLLSGGDVPANAQGKADLQHARLQALYDLGRLNAVVELVERSPGGREDPQAAAVAVDALLAMGKDKAACDLGQRKGAARGGLYWRKLRAFCMAVSGNTQGAELTAGLLAEEKDVGPAFMEQILAITLPAGKPDPKAKPVNVANALDLAMAQAAHKNINTDNLPLALAVGLMGQNPDDPALTLQAVSAGAVPAHVLASQLLTMGTPAPPKQSPASSAATAKPDAAPAPAPDPDAEQAQMLAAAQKDDSVQGLASLFWLAQDGVTADLRAQAIQSILHRPASPTEKLALVRLVAPLAAKIMPAPDLSHMAVDFARMALLRNDPAMALLWFQQAPQDGPQAEDMDVALYALGGKVLVNADTLKARLHGDEATKAKLLRSLLVANVLRQEPDPALRTVLSQMDTADTCPVGPLAALHNAARANARGETILRALSLSGNEPLSALPAGCGAGIVSALQTTGFTDAARTFAMEWLFASQWKDE